jgi:hypothetical protein
MEPKTLGELIALMKDGPATKQPRHEEWSNTVARITVPGRVNEVSEDTYLHYRDSLPPRWQQKSGSVFAFAEGSEPLRVFWRVGINFYSRQLTEEESEAFSRLAGITAANRE